MGLTATSALGSASGTHALTLTDDEAGAITFTAPTGSTSESAGTYGATGRLTISGTGTGPLASVVDAAAAKGITWFNSGGNDAAGSYGRFTEGVDASGYQHGG